MMAAESLRGCAVELFDAMPSVGRKFLLAGKGGLNLTHAEPMEPFLGRYGPARERLQPWIEAFPPEALRAWASELGVETFVGTSNRVFPTEMKAAPLLRAWLQRLRRSGVQLHARQRWIGWDGDQLRFADGTTRRFDAVVLALGGASWPKLGSDGSWVELIEQRGVAVNRLKPSNCGFDVTWSEHFRTRFAGEPLKSVTMRGRQGECVVTETGLEGSLVYALSASLRDEIENQGYAELCIDLSPGRDPVRLTRELSKDRGSRSLSNHLRTKAGIEGVRAGLLREVGSPEQLADPVQLAQLIKSLPLRIRACRPLEEAISTAGGVDLEELDERLMLRRLPGFFCAGEMLDWEAPTGGYLLSACFASGRAAGLGVSEWLEVSSTSGQGKIQL
jgi:uncharacterized flavoprotein (TIGR03862 family)